MLLPFALILTLFTSTVWAVECQWWQTQVEGSTIPKHPRLGHPVKQHPRSEHCREKWKGADHHIKLLKNNPIPRWNPKEQFRIWKREEMQTVLQIISTLPEWPGIETHQLYRAIKSIQGNNPATHESTTRSIVLYDQFFSEKRKDTILVHEASHHIYDRLSPNDIGEFFDLAGWSVKVDPSGKVYEILPTSLVKPDSAIDKDEDFSNHVEEFFLKSFFLSKTISKTIRFLQIKVYQMKIFYFSLSLLIGCASLTASLPRYKIMDDLWKKRATREEIIKQFGKPNELVENGMTYRESPNRITSVHFFNKDNTLKSQLIFVTANELRDLKDKFTCSWDKWTENQQRSHYFRTIELGKCAAKDINYCEWDSMKLYEVRWEK